MRNSTVAPLPSQDGGPADVRLLSPDTSAPLPRVIDRLTRAGCEPRSTGPGKWESRCPVHKGTRRNLSIGEGTDGAVLLRCHHVDDSGRNCPAAAIVAELGLELKDLFNPPAPGSSRTRKGIPAKPPSANGKPKRKPAGFDSPRDAAAVLSRKLGVGPTAHWVYRLDGSAVAVVYRFDPRDGEKTYRPVSLDPQTGLWVIGDPPGPWVLYRIDELPTAPRVYFAEGEKCVDLIRTLGLIATTTAHGAGSPHKSDLTPLAGKEIIILPDVGAPGEGYVNALMPLLGKLEPRPRMKVVRLPDLVGDGEDVEEWIGLHREWTPDRTRSELERLADAATVEPEPSIVGFVGTPLQECPKFEGPPRALTADLLSVPVMPLELIPPALRGWLVNIARRGCFPIEYPTASAIVALSSLIGRNLAIRPKRRDSWTVVPNLWGANVGPPGIQKSPSVEETLLPLKRLVAEAIEAHAEAQKRAMEDSAVAEAKAAAAKKKLAEAAKKGGSDETLRGLAADANRAAEFVSPPLKRYIVNDVTVEKLGEILRENPNGLLQFRDELTGFLRSMERQGHESDRGFFLESWNGNGSYTFDRIGRGSIHIAALCLSIFGTIQPGPLARYLKGTVSGEDADGFMPRFQIIVYPNPPERFVNIDEWPDADAKNRAFEVFRWIASMDPGALGAEIDDDRGLRFLRFDPDAQGMFDDWRAELENRLRSGSEGPILTCHLAKYRSLMPSLALLMHVVESAGCDRLAPVTLAAAQAAAAWCELLEAHARRIYQSATEGDPDAAQRLAERIKASLPNPFTFRQVAIKGWSGLDTVEDVRKAVGLLEDRDWAKVVVRQPVGGGRPSEEVWINPAIRNGEGPTP